MKKQKIMTVAVAIGMIFMARTTFAASGTWNGISGNWSDTTNPGGVWTNGIPADGADATANFTGVNITINKTNTVDSARTIGNITFTDATTASHDLVINGSNTLTLDVTSGSPTINVTQSGRTLTISCPIAGDDGMTKSGAGILLLSGNNSYSGGTTVSGGTITVGNNNAFGTGLITVTESATIVSSYGAYPLMPNALHVNAGKTLTTDGSTQYYGMTFSGAVSGSGTITTGGSGNNSNTRNKLGLTNPGNTFTGTLRNAGGGARVVVNSLGDGGEIRLESSTGGFRLGTGTATPLVFNTRRVVLYASSGVYNDNTTATNTITITTALAYSGTGTRDLALGGANTGNNFFAGNITNNGASAVSVTKADAGTWILSGTNIYSGTTTVNAGTLVLSNAWSVASGKLDVKSGAKVRLDYTGSRPVSEFWTNSVQAANGIYNNVNAPNYILGSGSIMVGIETFTVTYNGNGNLGGSVPVDFNAYTNNAIVTVKGNEGALTKDNFSFGGWFMQDGPTYAPGSTFQITTNTTLYAAWVPAGTLIQIR